MVDQPVPVRAAWNGRTNGFSIAALTMSLFGCAIVLSIPFGIAGLVQSRRNGDRRGRILAIASLVINGLIVGAVAVAVVVGLSDGPDRDANGVVRGERSISLARLEAGDCIKHLGVAVARYVDVVPCDRPHNSEVFATYAMADGEWPGAEQVQAIATADCEKRYPQYAGGELDSSTTVLGMGPADTSEWLGKRKVTCLTFRLSDTTGSVRE